MDRFGDCPSALDAPNLDLEHLERLGKGTPLLSGAARTVKATLGGMTSNQGGALQGMCSDTVDKIVAVIVKVATNGSMLYCRLLETCKDATSWTVIQTHTCESGSERARETVTKKERARDGE